VLKVQNPTLKKMTSTTCSLLVAVLVNLSLFSCVDDSSRAGRKIISRGRVVEEVSEFCLETYNISERTCINSCPNGSRVANNDEIEQAKSELNGLGLTSEELEDILANIEAAKQVCVVGSGVLRPDDQVFIDKGYCACQNGNPVSINDCIAFCSDKAVNNITLYGSVTLGPDILLNTTLGNLQNWCNAEIPNSDFVAPQCQLELYDGNAFTYFNITVAGNRFTALLDTLPKDVTYVARIKETGSGSNVQSQPFQLRLKDFDPNDQVADGPLKIMPVSQYSCIFLARQNEPVVSFTEYARRHFYFASSNNPPSLPPGLDLIKCHDKNIYGNNDSPLFPRLELIPQHFAVWDQSDVRFSDADGDGAIDINTEVTKEFRDRTGNSDAELNIFSVFAWPNIPAVEDYKDLGNPNLGFILLPFVDDQNRGTCPKQQDYLGNRPIYQIIGEKVGVDTEGLFMAESEPYIDQTGSSILDILLIREGQLKKVWFYFENGQHLIPDPVTAGSKTVHFYWPLDTENPYIRKSDQLIYTVRYPDQIGKNGVQTGVVTGLRPPDKRFACIPAID